MTATIDVPNSFREIFDLYYERGWTDGLPVIPPTEDLVAEMLRFTDRQQDEVICELPPRGGVVTTELLAVNCVMAGCLPEYFPVVLAAIEAATEEKYNLYGRQTTTNPAGHLVLINGPIRKELDVNCAGQCFGPGWRANATIGRAVRLALRNIGGAIPQVTDMSTHGMPARYTYCVGEYEEESPWEPLHVELGYASETSTVTVFPGQCPVNSFEHVAKTPHRFLGTIASTMAHLGTNGIYRPGENMIFFAPESARFLSGFGWSKKDIKHALFEMARQKVKDARDRGGWFHATSPRTWIDIEDDEATMPVVKSPDSIFIAVAGGPGRHNLVIPTTGDLTECVTKPITFKDGSPVASVRDFLPMSPTMMRVVGAGLLAMCSMTVAKAAAPAYPERPVRLVVGFAPGGTADTLARLLTPRFNDALGKPWIIDNRAGASGNIATEIVAKSNPDGHTVLLALSTQLTVSPTLYKLPIDVQRDLQPVTIIATAQYMLAVNPSVKANSVRDLIELAKSQPGKLNYASAGVGSPHHLSAELFKTRAGVDMTHIAYKGGGPASAALLANEVQVIFGSLPSLLAHVRSGRVRPLAVTGASRSSELPDLPPISEAGLPGFDVTSWFGLLAAARTPERITRLLHDTAVSVVKLPDVSAAIRRQGLEVATMGPREFDAYMRAETSTWSKVISAANIRLD